MSVANGNISSINILSGDSLLVSKKHRLFESLFDYEVGNLEIHFIDFYGREMNRNDVDQTEIFRSVRNEVIEQTVFYHPLFLPLISVRIV